MFSFSLLFLILSASTVDAHIGERIFPIPEIKDVALESIDLHNGDLEDWADVGLYPTLMPTDFFTMSTVGGQPGAPYDPDDLDYEIWLGWNGSTSRLYFGWTRVDDAFVNEYAGGNLNGYQSSGYKHDGFFHLQVDGDHSGGNFSAYADPSWTEDERLLNNNRTAQHYMGITDTPDGKHLGYMGTGFDWVMEPPYADGFGITIGSGPAISTMECFVTLFDDLIWNSPELSKPSVLSTGKIIGLNIEIPDFEDGPMIYSGHHRLIEPEDALPWAFSEHFVDARLISTQDETSVESTAWGRIKAAFQGE
jgi:hypothetical protein